MAVVCPECGDHFSEKRWSLGYRVCLSCGDDAAVQARKLWTVVPGHKSNYMLITRKSELIGINTKGTK